MRKGTIMFQKPPVRSRKIRRTVPINELSPEVYTALSEKFHATCARVTDPYLAAELIGCEIRIGKDGAPEVRY